MFEVGPFRQSVERITFTASDGEPANLFLMASGNGRGKTTALEALYFLMRMLARDFPSTADLAHDFASELRAQFQLDLLITLEEGVRSWNILLSLSWGVTSESGLSGWNTDPLEGSTAEYWLRYGWVRDSQTGKPIKASLPLPASGGWQSQQEAESLLSRLLLALENEEQNLKWPGLVLEPSHLPTLLYFAANRDIAHQHEQQMVLGRPVIPRYRAAHRFEREGNQWLASIENLLVWYFWINKEIFKKACDAVRELVFSGSPNKYIQDEPQRDPPRVLVVNEGRIHPLDRLSSGERNLIQFILRYIAHRTQYTILLIDEVELHLHPEFQSQFLDMLKRQAAESPGLTVIFTTHSLELMNRYQYETPEANLHKGGAFLLKE
jgi:hypothetical protein